MRTTTRVRAAALASILVGTASAVTAVQGEGPTATLHWYVASENFRSSSYEFPPTTAGVHSGFYWPVLDPIETAMFSGVGASVFNQGLDNLVCWGYNADCTGPFNRFEHFFNIVMEGSYDEDPAPGTDDGQNWVEVNWNYGAADVTCPPTGTAADGCWRPFAFVLDEGQNSNRGGAQWLFTANDEDGGDNTSLILRWPFASVGPRARSDIWTDAAFSSWSRTSTFDPGGTAYGIKGRFYLDHTNDRTGPYQIGLDMLTDYNSTEPESRAGGVIGGRFTSRASGSTDFRDAVFVDGLHVNVEARSTSLGMTLRSGYAIRTHHDLSGKDVALTTTAGLYVDQPTAPGTSTTTRNHYGILIDDQRFDRDGMEGGHAIAVMSQSTRSSSEGNLYMAGGTHDTGHVQLANDHLWSDTANNRLRFKSDSPPSSATDGKYLVMGGTGGGYGPVGWAGSGVTCATTCSFLGGSCEKSVCLEKVGVPCNAILTEVACSVTDGKRMCLCN